MTTLLFSESPVLATVVACAAVVAYKQNYKKIFGLTIFIMIYLIVAYRYVPHTVSHNDQTIISPAEGRITEFFTYNKTKDKDGKRLHISIFLHLLNSHYQIYPINGVAEKPVYDATGIYDIVVDANKSRDNEKVIHTINFGKNEHIIVKQIAGYCVRSITYDDHVQNIKAGDYMGMIKFGSRVDIDMPIHAFGKTLKLEDGVANNTIRVGDVIGTYV